MQGHVYYLTLINCHVKMLVESLVLSCYTYAVPVWGPAIHHWDSLFIYHVFKVELCVWPVIYANLIMFPNIDKSWMAPSLLVCVCSITHCLQCLQLLWGHQHCLEDGILMGPMCPQHFAAVSCCRKSFTKHFFHSQVAMWWNSLPSALLDNILDFRSSLFNYFLHLTWL